MVTGTGSGSSDSEPASAVSVAPSSAAASSITHNDDGGPTVVTFAIKNFWKVAKQQNDVESSEIGHCRGFYYRLLIHPQGTAGTESEASHLSVFLEAVRQPWFPDDWVFPNVRFELTVVNYRDPKQSVTSWAHWSFSSDATSRGWQKMLSHARLTRAAGFMDHEGCVLIRGKAEPPYETLWSRVPQYAPQDLWASATISPSQPVPGSLVSPGQSALLISDQVVPSFRVALHVDYVACFLLILYHLKEFRREILHWNAPNRFGRHRCVRAVTRKTKGRPDSDGHTGSKTVIDLFSSSSSPYKILEALQETFSEIYLWPLVATAHHLLAKHEGRLKADGLGNNRLREADRFSLASKVAVKASSEHNVANPSSICDLDAFEHLRSQVADAARPSRRLRGGHLSNEPSASTSSECDGEILDTTTVFVSGRTLSRAEAPVEVLQPSARAVMRALGLHDVQGLDVPDPFPKIHADLFSAIHKECQISYARHVCNSRASGNMQVLATTVEPSNPVVAATTTNAIIVPAAAVVAAAAASAIPSCSSTVSDDMNCEDDLCTEEECDAQALDRAMRALFSASSPPAERPLLSHCDYATAYVRVKHVHSMYRALEQCGRKLQKFPEVLFIYLSPQRNAKKGELFDVPLRLEASSLLAESPVDGAEPAASRLDKWYSLFATVIREGGDTVSNSGNAQVRHTLLLRPEEDGPWYRFARDRVERLSPHVDFSEWKCHRDFFCSAAVYIAEDYIDTMASGDVNLEGTLRDLNYTLYRRTLENRFHTTEEAIFRALKVGCHQLHKTGENNSPLEEGTGGKNQDQDAGGHPSQESFHAANNILRTPDLPPPPCSSGIFHSEDFCPAVWSGSITSCCCCCCCCHQSFWGAERAREAARLEGSDDPAISTESSADQYITAGPDTPFSTVSGRRGTGETDTCNTTRKLSRFPVPAGSQSQGSHQPAITTEGKRLVCCQRKNCAVRSLGFKKRAHRCDNLAVRLFPADTSNKFLMTADAPLYKNNMSSYGRTLQWASLGLSKSCLPLSELAIAYPGTLFWSPMFRISRSIGLNATAYRECVELHYNIYHCRLTECLRTGSGRSELQRLLVEALVDRLALACCVRRASLDGNTGGNHFVVKPKKLRASSHSNFVRPTQNRLSCTDNRKSGFSDSADLPVRTRYRSRSEDVISRVWCERLVCTLGKCVRSGASRNLELLVCFLLELQLELESFFRGHRTQFNKGNCKNVCEGGSGKVEEIHHRGSKSDAPSKVTFCKDLDCFVDAWLTRLWTAAANLFVAATLAASVATKKALTDSNDPLNDANLDWGLIDGQAPPRSEKEPLPASQSSILLEADFDDREFIEDLISLTDRIQDNTESSNDILLDTAGDVPTTVDSTQIQYGAADRPSAKRHSASFETTKNGSDRNKETLFRDRDWNEPHLHPRMGFADIVCNSVTAALELKSNSILQADHGTNSVTRHQKLSPLGTKPLTTGDLDKFEISDTDDNCGVRGSCCNQALSLIERNGNTLSRRHGAATAEQFPIRTTTSEKVDYSDDEGTSSHDIEMDQHLASTLDVDNFLTPAEVSELYTMCGSSSTDPSAAASVNRFLLPSCTGVLEASIRGLRNTWDNLLGVPSGFQQQLVASRFLRVALVTSRDLVGLEGFASEQDPPVKRVVTIRSGATVASLYALVRFLLLRRSAQSLEDTALALQVSSERTWIGTNADSFMLYGLVPDPDPTRRGRLRYVYMTSEESLDFFADSRRRLATPETVDVVVLLVRVSPSLVANAGQSTVPSAAGVIRARRGKTNKAAAAGAAAAARVPVGTFPRPTDVATPLLVFKWFDSVSLELICLGTRVCSASRKLEDYILKWVVPRARRRGLISDSGFEMEDEVSRFAVSEECDVRTCQNVRRYNAAIKKINKRTGDVIIVERRPSNVVSGPPAPLDAVALEGLSLLVNGFNVPETQLRALTTAIGLDSAVSIGPKINSQSRADFTFGPNKSVLPDKTNGTSKNSNGEPDATLGPNPPPYSKTGVEATQGAKLSLSVGNRRKRKTRNKGHIPPVLPTTGSLAGIEKESNEEQINELNEVEPKRETEALTANKRVDNAASTRSNGKESAVQNTVPSASAAAAEAVLSSFPDTVGAVMRQFLRFEEDSENGDGGLENLRVSLEGDPEVFSAAVINAVLSEITQEPLRDRLGTQRTRRGRNNGALLPPLSRRSRRSTKNGGFTLSVAASWAAFYVDRLFMDYLRDDRVSQQKILVSFQTLLIRKITALVPTSILRSKLEDATVVANASNPPRKEAYDFPIQIPLGDGETDSDVLDSEAALFERAIAPEQVAATELCVALFLSSDVVGTKRGLYALINTLLGGDGAATRASRVSLEQSPDLGAAAGLVQRCMALSTLCFLCRILGSQQLVGLSESQAGRRHFDILMRKLSDWLRRLSTQAFAEVPKYLRRHRAFVRYTYWALVLVLKGVLAERGPAVYATVTRETEAALALASLPFPSAGGGSIGQFGTTASSSLAARAAGNRASRLRRGCWTSSTAKDGSNTREIGVRHGPDGRHGTSYSYKHHGSKHGNIGGLDKRHTEFREVSISVDGEEIIEDIIVEDEAALDGDDEDDELDDVELEEDIEEDDDDIDADLEEVVEGDEEDEKQLQTHAAQRLTGNASRSAGRLQQRPRWGNAQSGESSLRKFKKGRNRTASSAESALQTKGQPALSIDSSESSSQRVIHQVQHQQTSAEQRFLDKKTGRPKVSKDRPTVVHSSKTWFVTYKPAFWHCSGPAHCVDRAIDLHRLKQGDIERTLKNVSIAELQHSGRMESFHLWLMKMFPLQETIRRWTELECGLCHRIDLETSGAVLVARTRRTRDFLWDQFRRRNVHKEYLLLCHGRIKKRFGVVKTRLLTKDYDSRSRIKSHFTQVVSEGGEDSLTEYHLCRVYRRKNWSEIIDCLKQDPPRVGEYILPDPTADEVDEPDGGAEDSAAVANNGSSREDIRRARRRARKGPPNVNTVSNAPGSVNSTAHSSANDARNADSADNSCRVFLDPSLTGKYTDEEEFSLCKCRIVTGRTHQIRVHMRYIGHPLVSDTKYLETRKCREDRQWCPRMFLHAALLEFADADRPNSFIESVCPLAHELVQALDRALDLVDDYEPLAMAQYGIPAAGTVMSSGSHSTVQSPNAAVLPAGSSSQPNSSNQGQQNNSAGNRKRARKWK